jgi:hypothetical protein
MPRPHRSNPGTFPPDSSVRCPAVIYCGAPAAPAVCASGGRHGPAGTGKTAIAGRVVSLSNPAERKRLLAEAGRSGMPTRGKRSVAAHVHAWGLTADREADLIAGQMVRAGVLVAQPERRNAAELGGYRCSGIVGHRHCADGSSKEARL